MEIICQFCNNTGMVRDCPECSEDPSEMCSTCDGEGYVDCPKIEEAWHK